MTTTDNTGLDRIFNFSPGPAALPLPVLQRVQQELLSLPGCGASILEISHRCPAFDEILAGAETHLAALLELPADYRILFLQGGARLQFSMVPMNLLRGAGGPADYLVTGSWSEKALAEAEKEGLARICWSGKTDGYRRLPSRDELEVAENAAYVYFASNETIQGVQFSEDPEPWGDAPLVCDASSDFLWRPIDVSRYGLLYACAQKNAGPAGVTVVIVREDLLDRSQDSLPGYLNYRAHAKAGSRYNTPPTFAIYVLGLVAQWLREEVGGLAAMQQRNQEKAELLYSEIDQSDGFYQGHAAPECRSAMNVVFTLPDAEREQLFLAGAEQESLGSLAGHRSVGGIRASIYNAMPPEGVVALRDFMRDFRQQHG